jgi:hypothetical protein
MSHADETREKSATPELKPAGHRTKLWQVAFGAFAVLACLGVLLFVLLQGQRGAPSRAQISLSSHSASNFIAATQAGILTPKQKWNLATSVGAYKRVGHRDPKWDAAAIEALELFAITRGLKWTEEVEKTELMIGKQARTARSQGCQDPFIQHLSYRFFTPRDGIRRVGQQYDEHKLLVALLDSPYPPVRKFNGCVLLIESYVTDGRDDGLFPALFESCNKFIKLCFDDKDIPDEELFFLADSYIVASRGARQDFEQAWRNIESRVNKRLGGTYYAPLTKGAAYVQGAWAAYGSGLMGERLIVARTNVEKAWKMGCNRSYVPCLMMEIVLLQGNDPTEMMTWFKRAMVINPDNEGACSQLLNSLTPRWGGSVEDLLAFGRKCLTNQVWGGKVPYLVVSAHMEIASALPSEEHMQYFGREDVWQDVKSAFDLLLQRFPLNIKYKREYFEWAFRCRRGEEVKVLEAKFDEAQKAIQIAQAPPQVSRPRRMLTSPKR